MSGLFHLRYGVIPACDVATIEEFETIVKVTSPIDGIVGFKIGCILGLRYGLPALVEVTRKHSLLPVIYDHQKAGTDIPDLATAFVGVVTGAGIEGVIIFPQAGPQTELAFIRAASRAGVTPIVGGEMTHPQYLASEGGFLRTSAPQEMYEEGAREGVSFFVVPGNRTEAIRKYVRLLSELVDAPGFLMPGIGRQGGDLAQAFAATAGCASYAIIGSGIYRAPDIEKAAARFCDAALRFQ